LKQIDDAATQRFAFAAGDLGSLSTFPRLIRLIGYLIELCINGIPWLAFGFYKFMFADVSEILLEIPAIECCGNLLFGMKIIECQTFDGNILQFRRPSG